jgi:hypothetical protein
MTVSKNTKVTLTIEQLQSIVSKSVDTKVRQILNEYIDEGLIGNPEIQEIKTQNELAESFLALNEQMQEIASKMGLNGNSKVSKFGNIQENANKFDRTKYRSQLSKHAQLSADNSYNGIGNDDDRTLSLTTANMNGRNGSMPVSNRAEQKIVETLESQKTGDPERDMMLDMIMETDGIAEVR